MPVGGLWEFSEWEVVVDFVSEPGLEAYVERCPHTQERDGVRVWPLVAVCRNEAGYGTTGLCLLCAADQCAALSTYVAARAAAFAVLALVARGVHA